MSFHSFAASTVRGSIAKLFQRGLLEKKVFGSRDVRYRAVARGVEEAPAAPDQSALADETAINVEAVEVVEYDPELAEADRILMAPFLSQDETQMGQG